MEKVAPPGSKKTQDDSSSGDQEAPRGEGGEPNESAAEKTDKEEGEKHVTPVNQKRERNASSSTPRAPSRSTRSSNNPEFVAKQRHFLQKVNQGVFYQSSEEESDYASTNGQNIASKRKRSVSGGPIHSEASGVVKSTSSVDTGAGSNSSHSSSPASTSGSKGSTAVKKRKYEVDELTRDIYCWVCHREMGTSSGGSTLPCEVCPRVYHARCCHNIDPGSPHPYSPSSSSTRSSSPAPSKKGWACPECVKIVRAETMGTRSRAMQLISLDHLCHLLKFVLTRVRAVTGAEPFYGAVDLLQFPRYREFVANPMDLGLIDRNIRRRTYGSTEAFFADMKWLVHNSIIFNTQHSKLTSIARSMLKICRQELMEIENCPDCYSNAHTRKDNWFIDVCKRPHILVWAKLKGFPHWPAKAMRVNKESCVDVRFFGAHDRAWVPARDCYLYSKEMPAPPKNRKKNNFDGCIMEVEDHIKKLKEKYGVFVYAPLRTVYDPSQDEEILMKMLPKYQPVNFDGPPSFSRENLQEDQISRESPSISTGTEEESDRDHSVDGDSTSNKRGDFDHAFEDSMEIPSGSEASSQKENVPTSTQPPEETDKTSEEPAVESKASKDKPLTMETKSDTETKEEKGGAEEKDKDNKIETGDKEVKDSSKPEETEDKSEVKGKDIEDSTKEPSAEGVEGVREVKDDEVKEESESVDGDKERRDGDSGETQMETNEEKDDEKEVEVQEEESAVKIKPIQEDKMKDSPSITEEEDVEMKETVPAETIDKEVVSGVGKGGEKEKDNTDKERADESSLIDDSEVAVKVAVDSSKGTPPLIDELDKAQKTEKKDVEDSSVGDQSVEKGLSESSGEGNSATKALAGMEKKDDVESTCEEEKSIGGETHPLSEVSASKRSSEELEKNASEKEGKGKIALDECVNDDSEDEKLDALIDHKIVPEIPKIIKTAGTEDDPIKIAPSVDSPKKEKPPDGKTPEKGCDKAESAALDRDGEENRAKLFQSLRLVNIETLNKKDTKESDTNKESPSVVSGNQLDATNKIDVNKLRESLMTKCAGSAAINNDSNSSENKASNSSDNSPCNLSARAKISESGNVVPEDESVSENMDVDGEDVTDDAPTTSSAIPTSPGSNKGDVGSQLRVLGKLQQRLSFIKESASDSEESALEKEDENTVEDADSATGDASGTSNSDDEESASLKGKKLEAEEEVAKNTIEGADVSVDSIVKEDSSRVAVKCTKALTGKEKKVKELSDKALAKDESLSVSEVQTEEKSTSIVNEGGDKDEKVDAMECDKDESSVESTSKASDSETENPKKSVECKKEDNLVKAKKSLKGKASEVADSDRASPSNPRRPSLLEDNDSVNSGASPLRGKGEEIIEEEVLNREVLKESNMVVVQKTVKTRRIDDHSSGGSAPKRARKAIVPRSSVVDRCESPSQDEVFPSMFLDPSVTITVLQESEKENGVNREQSSSSSSIEDLRTSVNLSNDVSLTMVQGSGHLEGFTAMHDGAISRSSESLEGDVLGQSAQNSSVVPQFRPRARKSFPRPSPRSITRSPLSQSSPPNMEVRRLYANSSRDSSPVNVGGGPSLLKTASVNSMSPMLAAAMRSASTQPHSPVIPISTSPSPVFTGPSTSQGSVRSVVPPVMPSSSPLLSQNNGMSPRLPSLSPRPPNFPLTGHHSLFTPSEAGPVSAEFNKHAQKLSCYMRQAIEDIIGDLAKMGNPEASYKSLRLEMEKLRWEHAQEVAELKHNHELVLSEIKNSVEKEKMCLVNDVRKQCEAEKLQAIDETKQKQWCANCSKEALFYCCWNTSYCDYPCQQSHWPRHMALCAQNGMPESGSGDSNSSSNRKDGGKVGHRGPPPPPFHQLQRPVPQESHPEEEYFDEDSSSPPTPRTGTSGGTYRVKRRRCGVCKGCMVKDNCGNCAPCRNSKTHQVCKMRRCKSLQSDWPMGGSSRTVSPEPGANSVSLEKPPMTHSSKDGKAKKIVRKTS